MLIREWLYFPLWVCGLVIFFSSCQPGHKQPVNDGLLKNNNTESERLTEWLNNEYAKQLDFSPMTKTRLGDKSANGELDDVSEAAMFEQLEWYQDSVNQLLDNFEYAELNDEAQRSFDLWVYHLRQAEASLKYRRHQFIFGRYGPQSSLPNSFINYQIVETRQDARDYISRLNQSGHYLMQYLERARLGALDGIRPPFFDYELAISEIKRVLTGHPFNEDGESVLWNDFKGKVRDLSVKGVIEESEVNDFLVQAQNALLRQMLPAYEEILKWLIDDLKKASSVAQGAWALPDGEAYYQHRLEKMTTTELTAQEIHNIGLQEVGRIRMEMEQIKDSVGFDGSLADFFSFLRDDDRFYYPNTDAGRADYIAEASEILSEVDNMLPSFFGILPKAGLEVRRVEAFREQDGGAAHYRRGTADGSRPGVFYAHLSDMRAVSKFRLPSLAFHEGLPGHHMQISIQQELDILPMFRTHKGYTAFSEGWGLYAEWLGKEMGGYPDPYSDFGRLSGEMWRAIRLVVDTGIHALRWTQAQAETYALENSPRPESSVKAEVRRYFNNPGQATAYKIGMLRIQSARVNAESKMNDAFDLRNFHDQVLGSGQLPMRMLQDKLMAWSDQSLVTENRSRP